MSLNVNRVLTSIIFPALFLLSTHIIAQTDCAQGKLIRVEQTSGKTHVVEKGSLSAGAYFFRLTGTHSSSLTGRFDIK